MDMDGTLDALVTTQAPVKTAREKAVEVLGHQEGCPRPDPIIRDYTCNCYEDDLPVLLAAAQGTLRKEHECERTHEDYADHVCSCGVAWGSFEVEEETKPPGPCAPPLDPAKAWECYVACQVARSRSGQAAGIVERAWDRRPRMESDEEWRRFWAEVFLALSDRRLLKEE